MSICNRRHHPGNDPDSRGCRGHCLFGIRPRSTEDTVQGEQTQVRHETLQGNGSSIFDTANEDAARNEDCSASGCNQANAGHPGSEEQSPTVRTRRRSEEIQITEAEERLRSIFRLCDVTGHDRLDKKELIKLCKSSVDVAEFLGLRHAVDASDSDESHGEATWDEFRDYFLDTVSGSSTEHLTSKGREAPLCGHHEEPLEFTVRDSTGAGLLFRFDERPLPEQVRDLADSFNLSVEEDFVLTVGRASESMCSRAQLLSVSKNTPLDLRCAADVAREHLAGLRAALSSGNEKDTASQLRRLLSAIHAEPSLAKPVIDEDGIGDVFAAVSSKDCKAIHLATTCLCQLLCYQEGLHWLETHQNVIGCELFGHLLAATFPLPHDGLGDNPKLAVAPGVHPRSSLAICLFLLHMFPESAGDLHATISGDELGFTYERIIAAFDSTEYFEALAASSILCALLSAASVNEALTRLIERAIRDSPDGTTALEHVRHGGCQESLIEQVNALFMRECVQCRLATSCESWSGNGLSAPTLGQAGSSRTAALQVEVRRLRGEVQRLKNEVRHRHTIMCKMASYLKVENSNAIEETLPTVIRMGWDSVKWEGNYSLLHYAADCVDDPSVVELVALFASDVDKKDDHGMRAVDYAAKNSRIGVARVLNKLSSSECVAVGDGNHLQSSQETPEPEPEADQPLHDNGNAGDASHAEAEAHLQATLDKFFRRKRIQSVFSAGIDLLKEQARARQQDPDELGLAELRAELRRVKSENARLHEERQKELDESSDSTNFDSKKALGGPLDEISLQRYLTQLQAFGGEAVFQKLMEATISGGLALDETAALSAMKQLELVERLFHGRSPGNQRYLGTSNAFKHASQADVAFPNVDAHQAMPRRASETRRASDASASSFFSLHEGAACDPSPSTSCSPIAEASQQPVATKGKGKGKQKSPPAEKGSPAGGKSAKKGAKGKPPAPVGKGKTPSTDSAPTEETTFRRPVVVPQCPMKPLWWKAYHAGKNIKDGDTVWDKVTDEESVVPIEDLVCRFKKSETAKNVVTEKKKVASQTAMKVLRVVTDTQLVVGKEAALKRLPSPEDVVHAIEELNEDVLSLDRLQMLQDNACPSDTQLKQLAVLREQNPSVPMALPEQYMWMIGQIPAYRQRLECWAFVRSFEESHQLFTQTLELLEPIIDCFKKSEALPCLLGLILTVGNYLNGGTPRGRADGFDLETLGKLDSVKDADGKDLRHFVFNVFFNRLADKAQLLFQELAPCLLNVNRRITKDSDGVESLAKSARLTFEDIDQAIRAAEAESSAKKEMMHMVLQYIDDPADNFKLKMPNKFAHAMNLVDNLAKSRDRIKSKYGELLTWFKITGMKSGDFCLLWDNFLVPGDMIIGRPERVKKEVMVPRFCNSRPLDLDDLAMLWNLKAPRPLGAPSRSSSMLPRTSTNTKRHGRCNAKPSKGKRAPQRAAAIHSQFAERLMALSKKRKVGEEAARRFGRQWRAKVNRKVSENLDAIALDAAGGPSSCADAVFEKDAVCSNQSMSPTGKNRLLAAGFPQ